MPENKPYENYVLANEIEDQFNTHLDGDRFVTIDTSLEGTAGMKKIVHVYAATDGTQKLKQGEGNTVSITAAYQPREYNIELAQNRFEWYDEQEMKDPLIVEVGTSHMGTDMFNTTNNDIYAEFNKAKLELEVTTPNFEAFVDAAALFDTENLEGLEIFAWVSPFDTAKIRKALKDDLKYVEAFVRQGYIGTVAGINLYTRNDAVRGQIIVATKQAVTKFVKTGTQVEQFTRGSRSEEYENIRKNAIYSRKYYVVALTDETKVVKMMIGKDSSAKEVKIGDLTLTPSFAPGVRSYKAFTKNSKDAVTVTASSSEATVEIKNKESTVESGNEATWESGENIVTATVTNGSDKTQYTVVVTKE